MNDFAGVVDDATRQQLENILENLRLKTGIEFDIATVESTNGKELFDFSQQLAKDWNIGARTSARKSLLLVLSVNEKEAFTQFSKSVQSDLPEGVLGEMGQRMRALVHSGKFSDGLHAGVQLFVKALGEKLAFSTDDFEKAAATASETTSEAADNSTNKATDLVAPATTRARRAEPTPTIATPSPARQELASAKPKKPVTTVDDEAESEEVELTLTKPLEERVAILKAFLDDYPDSKSKARALELLVSAHAALGDERLKNGDRAGGVEQLFMAIAEAPLNPSERLFSGVIAQIPLNLYLRGETATATKAAENIETKFGNDPTRLVTLSGFYVNTERGGEAVRLATQAVQLAPDLAGAHLGLGRALHISLRLEEATAEYQRALELDPNSKAARRGLADLDRAFGKSDEALALYRQQIEADPADKSAQTGLILTLLDLHRTDEAKNELEVALRADPRNLPLLAGVAYWFAAHDDSELAYALAGRAIAIEPRYTWSQIALARALVGLKKPLEAERALRFARQYGNFPTLDYELASVLMSLGLYDEAAEVLAQAFSINGDQVETRLGGQTLTHAANFLDLLAPERRASIFQSTAADSESNARVLKALLALATLMNPEKTADTINEANAIAAAKEFAAGDDPARVHRELYAASRLLQKGVGFQAAYELAEAARNSADDGMTVPALTIVVQADEYRAIRSRAIAAGGTPDVPDAPRNVLSNLLRGRIEDISGWALYNQDKLEDAVDHLKRAVAVIPAGTPAARNSLWHLAVALDRQDKKEEALIYYIKGYNAGPPDPVRRTIIEQVYRKVNGSLAGLDERIGAATATLQTPAPENTPVATPEPAVTSPGNDAAPTPTTDAGMITTPQSTASPEAIAPSAEPSPTASATPPPEEPAAATPQPTATPDTSTTQPSATASPEPTTEPTETPIPEVPAVSTPTPEPPPTATPESTPAQTPNRTLDASPIEKMDKPTPTTVTITGRVKDSSDKPIANVVVVLISPLGTVLSATTDDQGNYSFTVASSSATRSYRIIPSRDGFSFEPVDRILPLASSPIKELDFVGSTAK